MRPSPRTVATLSPTLKAGGGFFRFIVRIDGSFAGDGPRRPRSPKPGRMKWGTEYGRPCRNHRARRANQAQASTAFVLRTDKEIPRRQNAAAGQRRYGLITQTAMQDGERRWFYTQARRLVRRGRRNRRREGIDYADDESMAPVGDRMIVLERGNVVAPGTGACGGRAGFIPHVVTGWMHRGFFGRLWDY